MRILHTVYLIYKRMKTVLIGLSIRILLSAQNYFGFRIIPIKPLITLSKKE